MPQAAQTAKGTLKRTLLSDISAKMAAHGFMLVCAVFAMSALGQAQPGARPSASNRAAALVQELRQFEAGLPAMGRSDGVPDLVEERRYRVYKELWILGLAAIPALSDGLADRDVQVRRSVALFLNFSAGTWNKSMTPPLNIRGCLRSLIAALKDPDERVRGLSAQAIGSIGSDASSAVPSLVALLASPSEGSRNSALIGLAGIGPAARDALPAVREALSDPSDNVRRFAQRAITMIDVP